MHGRNVILMSTIVLAFITIGVMAFPSAVSGESNAELSLGGVDPDSGDTSTFFTFYVTYRDPSGTPPDHVLLIIADSSVFMMPIGEDHSSGVIYQVRINLPEGDHQYYFMANNTEGCIRHPEDRDLAVQVKDVHSPELSDAKVTPHVGNTFDEFVFSVRYMDPEDRKPEMMVVRIDDSTHDMTTNGSDDWDLGVTYRFITKLSPGNHPYFFYTKAGEGSAQVPEEPGTYLYVLVDDPPIYTVIGQTPHLSNQGPDVFGIMIEGELTSNMTVDLILDDITHEMHRTSISGDGIQTFDVMTHLAFGMHRYHFLISWTGGELRYPDEGALEIEKTDTSDQVGTNIPPIPVFRIITTGRTVTLNSSSSFDPDGMISGSYWILDGELHFGEEVVHTFERFGYHTGSLSVTDDNITTITREFDIWAYDLHVHEPMNMISSYYTVDENLIIDKERGGNEIIIENGPFTDKGQRYSIKKELAGPGIIVLEVNSSIVPCWSEEEPKIVIDGTTLPMVDLATILSTIGDTEMASVIKNVDSYQIIIYIERNGSIDLRLCSLVVEKGESNVDLVNFPIVTIASVLIFLMSLITIGTFLLFRTRIFNGPRDPHEDFAISSTDLKNGSFVMDRKGKKIEWEAYLEE